MHHHYEDIRSKIAEPPKWFDEYAVPRYVDFAPNQTANIYANECALVLIGCQNCKAEFLVAFTSDDLTKHRHGRTIADAIRDGSIHYGDPQNSGCCQAGPTMNCMDLRVVEYWRQEIVSKWPEWVRFAEFEITLPDGTAS